jgi:hypothetical protein
MKASSNPAATIATFSLLGLVSAVLSILIPALLTARGSPVFMGSSLGLGPWDIFGAMISVYFWAFAGVRFVTKAIGLVVASTVAYFVAMILGMFAGMALSSAMGFQLNTESAELGAGMVAPLLIAGTTGAFLIIVAVLRLYSEDTWRGVLSKAFQWSWVGGVFALLGWGLGPSLGEAIWSALDSVALSDLGREMLTHDATPLNGFSLHIVWQVGMAVALGVMLSEIQLVPTTSAARAIPARKFNVGNAALFGVMALVLIWFGIRWAPDEYRDMRWHRTYAKHVAETPSFENLPQIETAPADAMLILTPFGDYLPDEGHAGTARYTTSVPVQYGAYTVRYSLAGAPKGGPYVGPHIDVQVQEWPNADWARWILAENGFSPGLQSGMEQTIHFGNRIVGVQMTEKARQVWGSGGRFGWRSNNHTVVIEAYSVNPDEFLRKYLEKYPSSL